MSSHLDLGCGNNPRNPLSKPRVCGVDIAPRKDSAEFDNGELRFADLACEAIPYSDSEFSSVSAYDFLEHIPRVQIVDNATVFPFIKLMSEIHRVLENGGTFIALTPVFPRESAMVDPTHVNFLTKNSYKYFCKPNTWASMYGFNGDFELVSNKVVNFSLETGRRPKLESYLYTAACFFNRTLKQHILWEFKCIK